MGKILIIAGLVLIIVGLIFQFGGKLPFFGKLPGDIVVDKPGFKVYFPLATSILISIILSLILYLINRFKNP